LNAVALRVAPPRSSTTKPKTEAAKSAPTVEQEDTRSQMQKLMDRFK
jgi:PTH1 family peptidyl-tRNA hydrolase